MRIAYNKLVRDRIPEIIALNGGLPVTHVLDGEGYRDALLAKLVEEAKEARDTEASDLPGELADVLEVLRALASVAGLTWEDLVELAAEKSARRGGFDGRIFLEYVDER
jgi:predicted house-cleaning noncanonical NTP pyrophosphatase (MazG superfamily)